MEALLPSVQLPALAQLMKLRRAGVENSRRRQPRRPSCSSNVKAAQAAADKAATLALPRTYGPEHDSWEPADGLPPDLCDGFVAQQRSSKRARHE